MAKTKGPLLSLEAHGSIADLLTFSRRTLLNLCRHQKKQKDRITTLRTTQRGYFQEGVEKWNLLTGAQQEQWHDFVKDP